MFQAISLNERNNGRCCRSGVSGGMMNRTTMTGSEAGVTSLTSC